MKDYTDDAIEKIEGKSFTAETVEMDGKFFVDCSFTRCDLIFRGTGPMGMDNRTAGQIKDSTLSFKDRAMLTVRSLNQLCQLGGTFRQWVERELKGGALGSGVNIKTRGGLGPCTLAAFLFDPPRRGLSPLVAQGLLAQAAPAEIAASRDSGLDYILTKLVPLQNPDAISAEVADIAFPADKDFRGAWKLSVGRIEVDMPKARDLWREHLRRLRAPLLAALDAEYLRADERGDLAAKAEIAAKKQALRDVTADPAIEAARTPEELKTVLPAVLNVTVTVR